MLVWEVDDVYLQLPWKDRHSLQTHDPYLSAKKAKLHLIYTSKMEVRWKKGHSKNRETQIQKKGVIIFVLI